jgi:hypothetical protein
MANEVYMILVREYDKREEGVSEFEECGVSEKVLVYT